MLIGTKSINVLVRTRLMNVEIVVNTLIITSMSHVNVLIR